MTIGAFARCALAIGMFLAAAPTMLAAETCDVCTLQLQHRTGTISVGLATLVQNR